MTSNTFVSFQYNACPTRTVFCVLSDTDHFTIDSTVTADTVNGRGFQGDYFYVFVRGYWSERM